MKVIHLSYYDTLGGAARAAYRIHTSLLRGGVESKMWVNRAFTGGPTIETSSTLGIRFPYLLRRLFVFPLVNFLKTRNPIIHSPSILPSQWLKKINNSDADLIHLHWIQNEMLSIEDIEKIKKPLLWTLHDMWGFCGAEHYTEDSRWKNGYRKNNRPEYESGFDLNLWTWKRKIKNWHKPKQIVTPSTWLSDCVSKSALMRRWPIITVPNPLDTTKWRQYDKILSRKKFGLPLDKSIILFGSMGGGNEPRKGLDLLLRALELYSKMDNSSDFELIIFGLHVSLPSNSSFTIRQLGTFDKDDDLSMLYSAADVLSAPSRQEVFGQTASEAHACGTPVIAFRTGGLIDIVEHKSTGYLADAFDVNDMAHGLVWLLKEDNLEVASRNARLRALSTFSEAVVADQYKRLYEDMIKSSKKESFSISD